MTQHTLSRQRGLHTHLCKQLAHTRKGVTLKVCLFLSRSSQVRTTRAEPRASTECAHASQHQRIVHCNKKIKFEAEHCVKILAQWLPLTDPPLPSPHPPSPPHSLSAMASGGAGVTLRGMAVTPFA